MSVSRVGIPISAAAALLNTAAPVAAQRLPSGWLPRLNEAMAYTPNILIGGCNAVIRSRDPTPREYAIAFNQARGARYGVEP
jgi:hypothetical protein